MVRILKFCILFCSSLVFVSSAFADDDDYSTLHLAKSQYAFGMRAAIDGFPFKSGLGNSYQVFGESIFPQQKYGLFSVGGHFGFFPLVVSGSPQADLTSSFTAGVQARYQLIKSKKQLFVPTIAIDLDYYQLAQTNSSGITNKASGMNLGLNAGIMIDLGSIDTQTARDSFSDLGIVKTYLTLEIKPLNLSNSIISVSGSLFYSGLRFEF
jgi:hypothetical protein